MNIFVQAFVAQFIHASNSFENLFSSERCLRCLPNFSHWRFTMHHAIHLFCYIADVSVGRVWESCLSIFSTARKSWMSDLIFPPSCDGMNIQRCDMKAFTKYIEMALMFFMFWRIVSSVTYICAVPYAVSLRDDNAFMMVETFVKY